MRFLRVLLCDIQYQVKYGFYFLYALISAIYIAILLIIPGSVRQTGTAVIIWSDPAALGFIFIGGMVLLEKGEGLHDYLSIIPVLPDEYIIAKAVSLSIISALAGTIIAMFALQGEVNYFLLSAGLVLGSALFTLLGLAVGAAARSVNHFLFLSIPVMIIFTAPSILVLFGASHLLIELLPATLLLRILLAATGAAAQTPIFGLAGLAVWLLPVYWLAKQRFLTCLQSARG